MSASEERPGEHERADLCPNCGATAADGPYCPSCGQRNEGVRVPFRRWLAHSVEDTLGVDGRLPRTLKKLILRPGSLTVEWREGRRERYVRPLRLYLLASLLFFGAALIPGYSLESGLSPEGQARADSLGTVAWQYEAEWLEMDAQGRDVAPKIFFAAVPFFALILAGVFYRRRLPFVDHVVFALHVHAFGFLLLLVTYPLDDLPDPWADVAGFTFLAGVVLHLVLALRRSYDVGWPRATLAGIGALAAYAIPVAISTFAVLDHRAGEVVDGRDVAYELYWEMRDALARSDTTAAHDLRLRSALAFRRLEAHAVDIHTRYHLGRLHLEGGDPEGARLLAREALLHQPHDLLTLGLAAEVSAALGVDSAAVGYARRFLQAYAGELSGSDEPPFAARHAGEIAGYRLLSEELSGRGPAEVPTSSAGEGSSGGPHPEGELPEPPRQ